MMDIDTRWVLPAGVTLSPVSNFPPAVRARIQCDEGDFILTRPHTRSRSKMIDSETAALLEEFRSPRTIIEAVIRYSRTRKKDPEEVLEQAFPLLRRFSEASLLAPEGSGEAAAIAASFQAGERVAGLEIDRCVQVLEDSELYQARTAFGEAVAFKIGRTGSSQEELGKMEREIAILRLLEGRTAPRLIDEGKLEDRRYLVMEWISGVPVTVAASELRRDLEARIQLLDLCCAILDAYSTLHLQGLVHSDVHPRNLLVDGAGSIRILDYGLAYSPDPALELPGLFLGGIEFLCDPERAQDIAVRRTPPAPTIAGEQYSLAALVHSLLTGVEYLDFSVERRTMAAQIISEDPLPFISRGIPSWPAVEKILKRALSKNPHHRFSSVEDFAASLREAGSSGESLDALEHAAAVAEPSLIETWLAELDLGRGLFRSSLPGPSCSVNYGAAGVAYALYRIACLRDSAPVLSLADAWAAKASGYSGQPGAFENESIGVTPDVTGCVSLYHRASGVYCVQALIAQAMDDIVSRYNAVHAFLAASSTECRNLDLTLGKSSSIIGCCQLLEALPPGASGERQALLNFGRALMVDIWGVIQTMRSIRECPQIDFLGIAHGWAGILYATLRWSLASASALPSGFIERLDQLAELAEPAGRGVRWKRKLQSRTSNDVFGASWCNGTAGFVHLWTMAYRAKGATEYLSLAEKSAWNVWEDQEPVPNLCCGLTGRSYALLNLFKVTGDKGWLRRAQDLAARAAATPQEFEYSHSLYKGKLGTMLLFADLACPEESAMPLFEPEGWPVHQGLAASQS